MSAPMWWRPPARWAARRAIASGRSSCRWAMPVIMLGLNQTIMAALSMLAIAAMVGTRDLGQQVYIALGKADAGLGRSPALPSRWSP